MPEEVEAYFAALVQDRRVALEEVRALILDVAPEAEETMWYRMPTYKVNGVHGDFAPNVLCALASQKQYMSLYMDPRLVKEHRQELAGLSLGKSCIRFKRLEDLPMETVRLMLEESLSSRESV
jgi:uncharacterized protein YdhG (YjbR/CyaY superfamily)